jgi:methylated-DNA-[protein]-cysteine S-methyltransferase
MKLNPNSIYTDVPTAHGTVILAETQRGLAGMWFSDQRYVPDLSSYQRCAANQATSLMKTAQQQLEAYFAGRLKTFDIPLDVSAGTAFQQVVWQALLQIPFGKTTSYGALSRSIGSPLAVRAVGTAIGRNPISVIIPCHRVLGVDGSLTGYAGGLHRKEMLLKLEATLTSISTSAHQRSTGQRKLRESPHAKHSPLSISRFCN